MGGSVPWRDEGPTHYPAGWRTGPAIGRRPVDTAGARHGRGERDVRRDPVGDRRAHRRPGRRLPHLEGPPQNAEQSKVIRPADTQFLTQDASLMSGNRSR